MFFVEKNNASCAQVVRPRCARTGHLSVAPVLLSFLARESPVRAQMYRSLKPKLFSSQSLELRSRLDTSPQTFKRGYLTIKKSFSRGRVYAAHRTGPIYRAHAHIMTYRINLPLRSAHLPHGISNLAHVSPPVSPISHPCPGQR